MNRTTSILKEISKVTIYKISRVDNVMVDALSKLAKNLVYYVDDFISIELYNYYIIALISLDFVNFIFPIGEVSITNKYFELD